MLFAMYVMFVPFVAKAIELDFATIMHYVVLVLVEEDLE